MSEDELTNTLQSAFSAVFGSAIENEDIDVSGVFGLKPQPSSDLTVLLTKKHPG